MKGDFSRRSFDEKKHFSRVLMQQGRVQLDSDWNEQVDIDLHYLRRLAQDLIGRHGTPANIDGFKIINRKRDYLIGSGHYYVDGILCENEEDVKATDQPHLPLDRYGFSPAQPTDPGTYLVYLDAWERHITPLDDPELLEPALEGADTTTRTKIIWQVKAKKVRPRTTTQRVDCDELLEDKWRNGSMGARVNPSIEYGGLEHNLYRVEIHEGGVTGSTDSPNFKWSRNNGTTEARIKELSLNEITLFESNTSHNLFNVGDWVELTDDRHELWGVPGAFAKIVMVEDNVLKHSSRYGEPVTNENFPQGYNPKARRWDGEENPVTLDAACEDWFELENGIEVQFIEGHYSTGDYWLIPSRSKGILWKTINGVPMHKPPDGVEHYRCPLALIRYGERGYTLQRDCRRLFPSLTDLNIHPLR